MRRLLALWLAAFVVRGIVTSTEGGRITLDTKDERGRDFVIAYSAEHYPRVQAGRCISVMYNLNQTTFERELFGIESASDCGEPN